MSLYRCGEPGWIRISEYDTAKRRALWIKINQDSIEFCAGREGDDVHFVFELKHNNYAEIEKFGKNLQEIVETVLWGLDPDDSTG